MSPIDDWIRDLIDMQQSGTKQMTLLAACPNSATVTEAAVKVAADNNAPMLFAATLNQVDRDGGYTGWTPSEFVAQIHDFAEKYQWDGPLYPCLDHGGPWLKDTHTLDGLSYEQTMHEVKQTLTACLKAGYQLLHIDATVDRTQPTDTPVPISLVVERTLDLMAYAERERQRLGLPAVSYEVGTEEVHGGLVDFDAFRTFIQDLRTGLEEAGLGYAWPCFVVGKVGTDLHTTFFDPQSARQLRELLAPLGSLVKGHYTDWVENPEEYPATGMGGANVGPELTAAEYKALAELCDKELELERTRPHVELSDFMEVLKQAVVRSGRWQKWLQPNERGRDFEYLGRERQNWLCETGARYVWADPEVQEARTRLYGNLALAMPDPHNYVVGRVADVLEHYARSFHLFDSLRVFEQ